MDEHQFHQRLRDFSGPISDAAMANPVINRVIKEYAHGAIITKEEALSRMVVLLAADWSARSEQAYRAYESLSFFRL